MAQTPRGGLYGPPPKGHLGVCAIYSETTVVGRWIVAGSRGSSFFGGPFMSIPSFPNQCESGKVLDPLFVHCETNAKNTKRPVESTTIVMHYGFHI